MCSYKSYPPTSTFSVPHMNRMTALSDCSTTDDCSDDEHIPISFLARRKGKSKRSAENSVARRNSLRRAPETVQRQPSLSRGKDADFMPSRIIPAQGQVDIPRGTKRRAENLTQQTSEHTSKRRNLGGQKTKVSPEIIESHIQRIEEYDLVCPLCYEPILGRKSDLKRHIQSHGKPSHQCTCCGRFLSRYDSLKRHRQTCLSPVL